MRSLYLIWLGCLLSGIASAKTLPEINFYGQPILEKGISLEPYALFYLDTSGDTLQQVWQIMKKPFVAPAQIPQLYSHTNRQMTETIQIVWQQFAIRNDHPTDTLHLEFAGGVHAVYSLYEKKADKFICIGRNGICVPEAPKISGYGTISIVIPPQSDRHYLVRTADYLIFLDSVIGTLYTRQNFAAFIKRQLALDRWLLGAMAMILGCVVLMGAYAFFQFCLTADYAFLYYTLYTVCASFLILLLANPRFTLGLTPERFPWLNHPVALSLNHLLALLYALFLVKLLNIRQQPSLWKVIRLIMMVLAVLQLMSIRQLFTGIWIKSNSLYFALDTFPALVMGILLIMATIRSQSKLKWYLLAGQISLFIIAISPFHGMFALHNPSEIEALFLNYPPFYMSLGLCMELFCFTLALAYRSKLVEAEKKVLQQTYARQLETELEDRTRKIEQQSRLLEKQHIRQLETDFEQQLAEVQMSALRAQMNPHFIFNCLNSIQLYTSSNHAAKASDYLNRFSQLIRLVLENSRSERVTLSNELEALQLYLDMEAMRFKDKLRFSIEMPAELDTGLIEIPPLLLQPYVENAIWHGLMHKPEGGQVHVKVDMPAGDCLQITITDDGVGRALAAAFKSKSATKHKSFGMKLTSERISLINRLYQTHTEVQIHDLTGADGKPCGTEVVLKIPV